MIQCDNLIHGVCLTNSTTRAHTHTCLQCVPASGCCCPSDLCPQSELPALPPVGSGPAPGSHCTSSSTGTVGSLGILPAARHAVPRSDAAPPAPEGQHNTKCCRKYLKRVCGVQVYVGVLGNSTQG